LKTLVGAASGRVESRFNKGSDIVWTHTQAGSVIMKPCGPDFDAYFTWFNSSAFTDNHNGLSIHSSLDIGP